MGIIIRGVGNVLRNPVRLILVVVLLGASLMFVAAMISLNSSAQNQLANVHKNVGTSITINYATNDANRFGGGGTTNNNMGRFRDFQQISTTPIPNDVVTKVQGVSGIASTEETIRQIDTGSELQTNAIQAPNGRSITIPVIVYGVSSGATHFTLGGGTTPAIVSGDAFSDNDNNANVAMMSQALATTNKLNVGSTLTLKGTSLKIVALYTTTNQLTSNTIALPLQTAQRLYNVAGVDSITAYATSYEQVQPVATQLKNILGNTYNIVTEDDLYQNTINALNLVQNSISLALIVSIAVAVIVIVFTVIIIVRERNTEIGIMKAIGASHWQVIGQFWGEVLTMSALGALVAVALLAVLGPTISRTFDISASSGGFGGRGGGGRFGGGGLFAQAQQANNVHLAVATLNIQTLLIILGVGIGLAVLTSMIPAWYVARLKPAIVLRRGN